MKILSLAVALSSDSLVVGAVDGSFAVCRVSKLRMAILFALYDATAATVGLLLGSWASQLQQVSAAMSFASWLILGALVADRFAGSASRTRRWPVHLLAFLFCIDNLAAGPALATMGVAPATCFGLAGAVSGLFFFLGVAFGHGAKVHLWRAGSTYFRTLRTRARTAMDLGPLSLSR